MSTTPNAKDIFADALDLAPQERDSFIRRACGADAALAADVLGLIATHERARNFLNVQAITGRGPVTEGPGTVIGHYKDASGPARPAPRG